MINEIISFLKSVIIKLTSVELMEIEFFLTIPPTLILLLSISVSDFISEGDWKYTTFSSKDFKTKIVVKIKVIKIISMKRNLNLTFRPYMA